VRQRQSQRPGLADQPVGQVRRRPGEPAPHPPQDRRGLVGGLDLVGGAHHQQPPAGSQHPRRLGDGGADVRDQVQDVDEVDRAGGAAGQREPLRIGHRDPPRQALLCPVQHPLGEIEPEDVPALAAQDSADECGAHPGLDHRGPRMKPGLQRRGGRLRLPEALALGVVVARRAVEGDAALRGGPAHVASG
jgi:hypothetical protein